MIGALGRVLALREEHRLAVERATLVWRLLNPGLAQVNEQTGETYWPATALRLDAKHQFAVSFGSGRGSLDHWLETRQFDSGDEGVA